MCGINRFLFFKRKKQEKNRALSSEQLTGFTRTHQIVNRTYE